MFSSSVIWHLTVAIHIESFKWEWRSLAYYSSLKDISYIYLINKQLKRFSWQIATSLQLNDICSFKIRLIRKDLIYTFAWFDMIDAHDLDAHRQIVNYDP